MRRPFRVVVLSYLLVFLRRGGAFSSLSGTRNRAVSAQKATAATGDDTTITTEKNQRPSPSSSARRPWFPARIQDAVDYDAAVRRLYLRHIVTETRPAAAAALRMAASACEGDDDDPFGRAAKAVSACAATKSGGGTIGWVERGDPRRIPESILTAAVIEELYALQPKAGDTHILFDEANERWHVMQVSELWMSENSYLAAVSDENGSGGAGEQEPPPVGSFSGTNVARPRRRKLKGHGVLPEFPELRSYHIQTSGCQMNVADSERLEGILQHDLRLTAAESPRRPIWSCSTRAAFAITPNKSSTTRWVPTPPPSAGANAWR